MLTLPILNQASIIAWPNGNRLLIGLFWVFILFVVSSGFANGQSKQRIDSRSDLHTAKLVSQLIAYGERKKDPEVLILAVQIAQSAQLRFKDTDPLSQAQLLAQDRPPLLEKIKDLRAEQNRGAQRGAWTGRVVTPPEKEHRQTIIFAKGAPALFGITGDGDTDLHLLVLDPTGKQVCGHNSPGDSKECVWTPATTSEFVIIVRNRGATANAINFWHN
jgi:hypothetical protein